MFNYVTDIHGRLTRQSSAGDLYIHFARTVYKQRSLQYYGPQLWNSGIPYLIVCVMLILLRLLKLYVNYGCFLNDMSTSNYCVFGNLCVFHVPYILYLP